MKKTIFLLFTIVCALAFAGCNDDDDPTVAASLQIVSSDVGFEASGGVGTITVETSESAIEASSDKSWLTITETTATSVTYSLDVNSNPLQRSGKITISAGGISREVTILQNGARFNIDSADAVVMDPSGVESSYIAFDSSLDDDPQISIPEEAATWLSATVETQQIRLTATLNYTGARSTVITVTQGWKPVEISVSQDMVELLDLTSIDFDRNAQTVTVTASEYMAIACSSWEVSSEDTWFTLTKNSDDAFTVSVEENTSGAIRTGTIDVKSDTGDILCTLDVRQKIYSYEFFLGEWTMNYSDSLPITLVENTPGESYLLNGWYFNGVLVSYVDTGDSAYLSITTQYMGSSGNYYIYICPLYGTSLTWAANIGMNFVFTNEHLLTAEDNGERGDVMGFQVAAFTAYPASSSGYVGGFATYRNITSLTRE